MSSTNKTTHYELSQYIGTDKPTYLGDYNSDMLAIDTAIYNASENASTAVSTANSAASTASDAATAASAATTTANTAANKADAAKTTAETASTNAAAALTAAQGAQTAASANTITNLAPAYDPTLTYAVGDLVTFIDDQGSGKLYKCIVDIGVPEAFNINKWDDVTTNEVYSKQKKSIILGTFNSGATNLEIMEGIRSAILPYLPELTRNYADAVVRMDITSEDAGSKDCSYYRISKVTYTDDSSYFIGLIRTDYTISLKSEFEYRLGTTANAIEIKFETTGITYTNINSDTIASDRRYTLIF